MSATTAWKRAWRRTSRSIGVFATIELTHPSPRTVWAGTREFLNSEDQFFQALIVEGFLHSPASWLSSDIELCTGRLTLAGDAQIGWQSAGQRLVDAFSAYRWRGARVKIWYWEFSLSDWATDAYQRFGADDGGEVTHAEIQQGDVVLHLRQSSDWNQPVQPMVVTRETDPNAPEDTIGTVVPILLGAHDQLPWRAPWTDPVNNFTTAASSVLSDNLSPFFRGGRGVARGVLSDLGRGAGKARVRVASHPVKALNDLALGTGVFIEEGDRLSLLEIPGGDVFNDATQGAGFLIGDSTPAWLPVPPESVEVIANTADDFRSILEAGDSSFVQFDTAGGKTKLRVRFPVPEDPGNLLITPPAFIVAFAYDVNGGALQAVLHNQATGLTSGTLFMLDSTPTRPSTIYYSLGINGSGQVLWGVAPLPSTPYNLGDLYLEFTSTSGRPRLYATSIAIRHRPTQTIVESARTIQTQSTRPVPIRIGSWNRPQGGPYGPYAVTEQVPAVTEFRGKVFVNVLGWPDNGSGDLTGTPNALVENPADLAALILVEMGLRTLAQLERGVGAHGSFVDAREAYRTWHGQPMKFRLGIHEETDVHTALSWLTAAAAAWIFISPSDGKFRILPWGVPGTTYDLPLGPTTVFESPRIRPLPGSTGSTGLRLPYGQDARQGDYLHETLVRADHPPGKGQSNAGYGFFGIRDESLKVAAGQNDRLDVRVGITSTAVTLAAQDNDYATLYADLKAKFNTAGLHGLRWGFAFGGVTYTGANKLAVTDGGTFIVTLADGIRTMEEQAAAWQAAIRAATGNNTWGVVYSRATGLHTFTRGSGPGTASIRFTDAAVIPDSAAAGIGLRPVNHNFVAGSLTSEFPVFERFFGISASSAFDLLHRTGTNGYLSATPRDAASVLGMDRRYDLAGASFYRGVCPKGYLEKTLAATAAAFDPKRTTTVEGRAIAHSATALEMRNRMIRLSSAMPDTVTLSSPFAADVERGQRLRVSADMDRLLPRTREGSSGSWADAGDVMLLESFDNFSRLTMATEMVAVDLTP